MILIFLKFISISVREMSEGELLQIEKARRLDIDEETYFKIITKKTASLIASCCALGAAASNGTKEQNHLYAFGRDLGIAFQLKDDLFDYGDKKIGKPVGVDLKEKKLTLPLIYALIQSSKEKKWLINSIKNQNKNTKVIKEVIDYVKAVGGLEYANNKLNLIHQSALNDLKELDESVYKESLIKLINYVIEREY